VAEHESTRLSISAASALILLIHAFADLIRCGFDSESKRVLDICCENIFIKRKL
jgi:hypothetical protein